MCVTESALVHACTGGQPLLRQGTCYCRQDGEDGCYKSLCPNTNMRDFFSNFCWSIPRKSPQANKECYTNISEKKMLTQVQAKSAVTLL